ncbi:MAG: hypothetical protein OXU61_10540, partial [Gammaproteobacteria bacterium]|nr:hypothetical protein [Gammaproteobacteria bacterium]
MLIKDVRNVSLIGSDSSNNGSKSVILCTGSLGFAFINITTLRVAKLHFSFCGAYFPSKSTVEENFAGSSYFKKYISKTTLYFLQTYNVIISQVVISNSSGAGLLGINMLGHSNISQTTFSGNEPNCLLIFIDFPSTSQINQPTLLTIVNSQMIFGSTSSWSKVAGLTITLAQTAYNIHIHIHGIIITHDNFHISIDKWVCHCSTIQLTQIVSTGKRNKLTVRLNTDGSPLPTCNCSEQAKDKYTVYISDIHFVGMYVQVTAGEHIKAAIETSDAMIKLQNITVQNTSKNEALTIWSIIMIMQDVRVSYSGGIKIRRSSVAVHGKFLVNHNVGDINTVQLRTSVTFFHGEA